VIVKSSKLKAFSFKLYALSFKFSTMTPTAIEKDIHNTLAYFAYNQYPLSIFELFKWQYKPERVYGYEEIKQCLKTSDWLAKRIGNFEGMYGIGTDGEVESQVANRKRRFLDSVRKQRKVCKVAQYLSRLSSVKAIGICNSLSYHFTREKSDIDIFVITKKDRVWTARFFCVVPMLLLRQRPGETKRDPVDLSFFVSQDELNLAGIKIDEYDPYLAFWIKNLIPVFGSKNIWDDFFAKNAWTNEYLPNAHRPYRAFHSRCDEKSLRFPCFIPESILRFVQILKMPYRMKAMANQGTCVVINDKMLKFHTTDRRAEIAEAFEKKCV